MVIPVAPLWWMTIVLYGTSCQSVSASKSRSKTIIHSLPFSGLCPDREPVLPSPILHLTFRTASLEDCHAARRSEDAARRPYHKRGCPRS